MRGWDGEEGEDQRLQPREPSARGAILHALGTPLYWQLTSATLALAVIALSIILASRPSINIVIQPPSPSAAPPGDSVLTGPIPLNLTLIRVKNVYTPSLIEGVNALLLAGSTVLAVGDITQLLPIYEGWMGHVEGLSFIDAPQLSALPGLVDLHFHATGGGGESGPESRVPPSRLGEVVSGGITSVVGVLGTDGLTRSPQEALATLRGLKAFGVSAWLNTGSYRYPPPLLTDDLMRDIVTIPEVMGMKLAVSDHRSSSPTTAEITRLLSELRVGGMLSNKKGVLYCHMGSAEDGLDPLIHVVNTTPYPITHILPTHIGRTERLTHQARQWIELGGSVDFTAGHGDISSIMSLIDAGYPSARLSVSSDSYGSLPVFDESGRLIQYTYQKPSVLWGSLLRSLINTTLSWSDAIAMYTSNPADFYELPGSKGRLVAGGSADVVLADLSGLDTREEGEGDQTELVKYVWANGIIMKAPGYLRRGLFEESSPCVAT